VGGLGFRRGLPARRPGTDLRRCSGGLCSTARLGRGAGDLGESACNVGVGNSFQREAGKAAGDRSDGGVLRLDEEGLDSLQIGAPQVGQETRQVMANRIGKRGRTRAHR
jgi:hypothetical protein